MFLLFVVVSTVACMQVQEEMLYEGKKKNFSWLVSFVLVKKKKKKKKLFATVIAFQIVGWMNNRKTINTPVWAPAILRLLGWYRRLACTWMAIGGDFMLQMSPVGVAKKNNLSRSETIKNNY